METIINSEGKTIFFSYDDFIKKIVDGNCCFICGAEAFSKEFNDEHIIPNWVLTKFALHKTTITLPNGTKFNYGQYKIPCCKECNSELGETFEIPVSELLKKNYEDIVQEVLTDKLKMQLLFRWISLIFFKTHLKDKALEMNRDKRFNEGKIGDHHYWEDMHHIHCLIRSSFTGAKIDSTVYGTIIILPVTGFKHDNLFDYVDTPFGRVVMIRMGSFCMIAVVDDGGAAAVILNKQISSIRGAVNLFQIREIISHLNAINLNLNERPVFKSLIREKGDGEYIIFADVPPVWKLEDEGSTWNDASYLLHHYASALMEHNDHNSKILEEIKNGRYSFLFNNQGEFISN
jgi:hypothetical protein